MYQRVFKVKWVITACAVPLLALMILASAASTPVNASLADATATFKAKCAACHGADGSGSTVMGKNLKLRDLRSAEVQKRTDAQLQTIIGKGKEKMPAFDSLGADQVKGLVAFVRELGKK